MTIQWDLGGFFGVDRVGVAFFKYNNTIYYIDTGLGTKADYILYVPDETGDTKEEIMEAAQKRIDDYLGKEAVAEVSLSYDKTMYDIWIDDMYFNYRESWEQDNPNMTLQEFDLNKDKYIDNERFYDLESYFAIDGVTGNDNTFIVKVKVGDKERDFNAIIKRDSSKMVTPSYRTVDMETDIEINSSDSSIPLDTHIRAEKVKENKYKEIIKRLKEKIKLLDENENLMFDLKLYSDSLEDYIKELPNGEFEVRIPISEDFKHKNLKAYYVDENGKVEKYDITKKDGYAIFRTNHFSIYTLAEEKVETYKLILDTNGGKFSDGKVKLEFEDVTECNIAEIKKPVRNGYTFKGWYTKKTGGKSIEIVMSSEDGIKENITFYAQWEKVYSADVETEIPEIGEQEEIDNTENTYFENTNTDNTNSGTVNVGNTNTGINNNNTVTGNKPQTGNNIIIFTVISVIALIGIAVAIKVKK